MGEINDKMRQALSHNGDLDYDPTREETLFGMIAESFKGKMRWMVLLVWVYGLVFTALAVFAAVSFFLADSVKMWIFYAALFLMTCNFIVVVKLWYWMLLNKNSVTREIKRLELQIAKLTQRLTASGTQR